MSRKTPWISALYLSAFALFFSLTENLFPRTQVNALLRAKRWDKIEEHFEKNNPQHREESYAIALAILENKEAGKLSNSDTVRAFLHFFSILDLPCPKAKKSKDKKDLLSCLKSLPIESRSKNIQRLSAWQASKQAERHKMPWLSLYFISTVSLKKNDPFTEKIFQQRMQQLLRNKVFASALLLAKRSDLRHWNSPFSNFLRARAYAYSKRKTQALSFYFRAAWSAGASWLRKSILNDIKNFYPELLSLDPKKENLLFPKVYQRQMISLSDLLKKKQLKKLKSLYNSHAIRKSANKEGLYMDGVFLIKSMQSASLPYLARDFHNYLQKRPKTLRSWALLLESLGKKEEAFKLLQSFRSSMPHSASLWQTYLKLFYLRNKENKDKRSAMGYFEELLAYLKRYPYHRNIQDLLMESLIGVKDKHIAWAPSVYWQKAKKTLPRHSASGRFFYWLRRYYKAHGKVKDLKRLERDFYIYAPGSFYATEVWAKNRSGRYIKAWRNIRKRKAYLRWISKYGGQERAWRFLRAKNIHKYQSPKAKKIASALKKKGKPSNDIVRLLFSLGEWVLGVQTFRELYSEELEPREYLLRLIRLGSWSRTLNVQIYYLRRLLWKEGIPIDPFSLPPYLSKLLYPRPYSHLVSSYSRRYGIEKSMSYALIHQESLFRENAVSPSGARGLMQIMPRTGRWLIPRVMKKKKANIDDPSVNIHLGIYYFSKLMKKNQRDFRWAAIAYNGGPGNLRKWKRKYYDNDFYYFLESLPVNEARNYCRITYENYLRYKIIYYLNP